MLRFVEGNDVFVKLPMHGARQNSLSYYKKTYSARCGDPTTGPNAVVGPHNIESGYQTTFQQPDILSQTGYFQRYLHSPSAGIINFTFSL